MRNYDEYDLLATKREHAALSPVPKFVRGPRLTFRPAAPGDAEFILSLRLDPEKNKHLSVVEDDVAAQRRWIEMLPLNQMYFIIEHAGKAVGTVRLYDQRGTMFCWGSWILSDTAPKSAAVESTLMVYELGLMLGFSGAHFDVRKENEKVWEYHERLGARRVRETNENYLYEISRTAIQDIFNRYSDRLPSPIVIDW